MGILCGFYNEYSEVSLTRILYKVFEKPAKALFFIILSLWRLMNTTQQKFAAYIGIDWADQKHDICLSTSIDSKAEYKKISSTPEALTEWLFQLRQRFPEGNIAVCLEQSRGALIYHLMTYDFLVLFPVNPITLARYRKAFNTVAQKMISLTLTYFAN